MIIVGVIDGVVDICVSVTPDQVQTVREMYPEHRIMEQVSGESIGWTFDGVGFSAPQN